MKDKICVVTGGNTGIGKATVAGLAQRGATVVIACRDVGKGKAALEEIAAKTGASEQGARTSLYLATAPEVAEISGRYFADAKEKQPGAAALDDVLAERLWTETERLVCRGRGHRGRPRKAPALPSETTVSGALHPRAR